ncbi:PKD-like family lipoprotein [Pedobacter metabolipauper]|uniref:PKD family protein n=1 Tax=Pedobacter metabolipauper TaxID=425513 RepID=A0A4R6SQ17_9SPHI|nr:PKD-like family lipoprotein [Pedobacter metabolipauper]TDQ06314.1 PKD family protein [Pedobacter metabolipauper]
MKLSKYLGYIFLLLATLAACKKDNGNYDYKELPDFYIDTVGVQKTFETPQSIGTVVITPKVVYNGSESNLEYLWRVYGTTADTLSREKEFRSVIANNPGTYTAELQVKEKTTGIRALMRYTIIVNSPRPYGWLVAYETQAGGSTDVALIRSTEIVKTITTDVVMRNIYSEVNGGPLAGTPVSIVSNVSSPAADMLFTSQTAVRLNRPDYKKLQDFNQLFVAGAPTPKPEAVMEVPFFGNHLINDGEVYWQYSGLFIGKISVDTKGYKAAPFGYAIYGKNGGFYDMLNRRFIYMEQQLSQAATYASPKAGSTARFNLGNIGKDLVYVGIGFGQNGVSSNPDTYKYAFFEDIDKSKRWFYGINFTLPDQPDLCMVDISAMPNIFNAKYFELGTLGSVAFYANDQILYNFTYNNATNTASTPSVAFTAPAGEVITSIKLLKQPGSGYTGTESKSNRIMYVATWNAATKNGKVYLLDANPTSGSLMATPLKVYDGFGKIKEMCLKPA